MSAPPPNLVLVAYDQTDTQGVADSVVKYLRRDRRYETVVVGPGHGRQFDQLAPALLEGVRFFLELDAVSGVLHHVEGLERLRCPKLAWFVDSHKKPHFHQRIADEFDVVFFTMWAWAGLFGDRGRWLPVHYDAELIGPRDLGPPTYDVGFVGSRPLERTRTLQDLARKHGWSLLLETTTGPREKELTAELYARCRIVFNQHVSNDLNFRMVEAQACRRLLLTDAQRNGQYELFQDREHVVYYKDDQDLEALLVRYLHEASERERIAAAGNALVSRLHTTEARVRELVAVAEQLVRERARHGEPPLALSQPEPPSWPRVLFLTSDFDPRTALGQASQALAVALATEMTVEVLAPDAPEIAPPGLTIHAAGGPPLPPLPAAPVAAALLANVPLVDAAHSLLATTPVESVVVAGWAAALTAQALGRPYLLVLDDLDVTPAPEAEGAAALDHVAWACEGATVTLVPSAAARQEILRARPSGELSPRVVVLPPGHEGTKLLGGLVRGAAPPRATRGEARAAAGTAYDRDYMVRYGYCLRRPEEERLKRIQAGVIARVLHPRRALVAGCAAGELLRPLLEGGIDAWGFDAARDLETFVYPEVRERVLPFDVASVGDFPFERAGGRFDTFVAVDLFEHVDEACVDAMLDGVTAHFDRLALVISSSPGFEGHVCVKPFPWWLARLEARGFGLLAEPSALEPGEEGTYGVRKYEGVRSDMSEQLVFLVRRAVANATSRPEPEHAERDRPDVSIGVVCCNRPDVLEVTLETTRASLAASSKAIEWLAYDNGSDEPVRRLLDDGAFDVVLRAGRNRGLAPALDALFRESRGRYQLTLEDDWQCLAATHEWLDLAVAILDSQPDIGLVRLRRPDDGQCGHFKRHRREVALRHHPWSVEPLPDVVEARVVLGQRIYVAGAEWVNWTHNPTLFRREVRDWIGPLVAYLPDPRDDRPRDGHPGLEGAIDRRWRGGSWKVAKLLDGPFTHIGDRPAPMEAP